MIAASGVRLLNISMFSCSSTDSSSDSTSSSSISGAAAGVTGLSSSDSSSDSSSHASSDSSSESFSSSSVSGTAAGVTGHSSNDSSSIRGGATGVCSLSSHSSSVSSSSVGSGLTLSLGARNMLLLSLILVNSLFVTATGQVWIIRIAKSIELLGMSANKNTCSSIHLKMINLLCDPLWMIPSDNSSISLDLSQVSTLVHLNPLVLHLQGVVLVFQLRQLILLGQKLEENELFSK